MQPYIFPHIGYFQLVNAVDHFIFYDDVNFIKRGWINRNRILLNGKDLLLTVPLIKASQNKLINEIDLFFDQQMKDDLIFKIECAYSKAPYYNELKSLINEIINTNVTKISEYAANSVISVSNYLEIDTTFDFSSIRSPESKGMHKADRLIHICRDLEADKYINSIGGQGLYEKEYFQSKGIHLSFLDSYPEPYSQFNFDFVSNLSIIDILMFNKKTVVKEMLDKYKLI